MRRDIYRRILLLTVVIVHLMVAFPLGHAATLTDGTASHLEHAALADQMPCHEQAPEEAPMTDNCSGHCFCCCAAAPYIMIGISHVPDAPAARSPFVDRQPALIEFYLPVETHPPNAFRYSA